MTKRAIIKNPRMKIKTIRRSLRLGDNYSFNSDPTSLFQRIATLERTTDRLATRMHNVMWCLHHGLYCDIKHLRNLTIPHYVN